ncbi:hypothetical protein GIB67_013014 [Kingdonia uniflora]|uniref:Uncharacterized protein n=1 Tax=Kingdonia uniflora TaxID=39325 RepID=A0A7J7MCI0_9MAGN|nr:hypothetical protein GIB67_013014 [Kingdonia uniflora]
MVRCKGHKCSWWIYVTRLLSSALFKVSTYCSVHTCIRVETDGENAYKVASSRWVASIIKRKLRKDPNYKPSRFIGDIQINRNIDVTYNLAWRVKESPRKCIIILYVICSPISVIRTTMFIILSFRMSFVRLTMSFVIQCFSFVLRYLSFDLRNYFKYEAAFSMHTNYLRAAFRK